MSPSDLPTVFAMKHGTAHAMAGEYAGAIMILEQTLSLESDGEGGLGDSDAYDPFQTFAWAKMMTGDTVDAEEIIARMEEVFLDKKSNGLLHTSEMRFYFAQNALLADDMETTLDRLQLAVDAGWRDYYLLLHDPRWESMRDNPRFMDMMDAVRGDVEAQRADVELLDEKDDFLARIDAAIAEFEARSGDD